MQGAWAPLIWSLALLLAVWWASRRFALYFMLTLLHLTNSERAASSIYAIAIFPGTVVHEASHWLMAQLVGVRTGRVHLLPVFEKTSIRLGSVDVRGGRLWQLTLIGLAPLLAGSVLMLLLSYSLFDVAAIGEAGLSQHWTEFFGLLRAGLAQPDALLMLYLLFTVSDAMFLSASDREPVQRMVLYLGVILVVLFALGWLPALPQSWADFIQQAFRFYAYGLGVTLLLHLSLAAIFFLILQVLRLTLDDGR